MLASSSTMPRCPRCQTEYGDGVIYCARDGEALLPMVLEGRYRLLSKLGEGGMGVVYLAEHMGLGKRVAVKVLRGELARDATFARRFELEAIAASQIGHENIVDVTDLGRTPSGELFYVMELLEGGSLAALLRRERLLPLGRAVPILVQVCRALEAAHGRGIIHRDIKPHNVMLLPRGGQPDFVKVVDFGISKMSALSGQLTGEGEILGTANYMSPEQARGTEVDARADVYSVGVLAYELCTGTLPFSGGNTFATMLQHMEARLEPPSQRRPDLGLPPELDALLAHALAKDPNARPSMARLRAGLEALPGAARAPVPAAAPVVGPPVEDESSLALTVLSGRGPRPRKWGWAVGLGVSGLLAVSAWLWSARGGPVAPGVTVPPAAPGASAAPRPEPARSVEPAPAPAAPARVRIDSVPSGATVSREGRVLGTTPLEVDKAQGDAGPWRFTLEGHAPLALERLPAGEPVSVTLKKLPPARATPSPPPRPLEKVKDLKPNPF